MKKLLFTLSLLGLAASTSARAETFASFIQLSPVTDASTIVCSNFVKGSNGAWKSVASVPFTLGIIRGIVPPARAIKSGGYIYNNVDLYAQLDYQCGAGVVVRARY